MTTWLAQAGERGRPVFRIGRDEHRCIADWPGIARLTFDCTSGVHTFEACAGADPDLVRKIEGGSAQALLRHARGELAMHASAVCSNRGAVAFVGDSGAGKSTFAHRLASMRDRSYALLADDCLSLDGTTAIPTESVSWLEREGRKLPQPPRRAATQRVPLKAIVSLVFAEGPISIARVRGAGALKVLYRAMVRFVLDDPNVHRADIERLSALVHRVPLFELRRPRGFEHFDATIAHLEQACACR
jgi:hypothetical protein